MKNLMVAAPHPKFPKYALVGARALFRWYTNVVTVSAQNHGGRFESRSMAQAPLVATLTRHFGASPQTKVSMRLITLATSNCLSLATHRSSPVDPLWILLLAHRPHQSCTIT